VISAPANWDPIPVREALSSAVETLWSTSRLGLEWQRTTQGQNTVEQLNGLASLLFAIDGHRLFLSNDPALLLATLNRKGSAPAPTGPVYASEFHPFQEQAHYRQLMNALDFSSRPQGFLINPQGDRTPPFFSENLASLNSVFSFVKSVTVTRFETNTVETQHVVYR
jgi:hypothetical protein